ncbi:MAG: AbrB/MazE/SpoVT family DNA-binding domain-containing protein [Deltaproteobacteria bacterium]|nr:AbrB/MazE/SpoVT family DNA-binding domain-containing protein [Deltaproteobacteria bacterium]
MEAINVKVSKRGYIVLPAGLRKEMDIKPGSGVLMLSVPLVTPWRDGW